VTHVLAGVALAVAVGATAASAVEGAEITLSPDSCRVPSLSNPEVKDVVVFSNAAEWELSSDSLLLTVVETDDAFGSRIESETPQVTISLNNNYYTYGVQRLGPRYFKLDGRMVRVYPYGGSNHMQSPSIGYSAGGSPVVLPERMTGLLDVYFNNGQKLTVRLYTDGVAPPVEILVPRRTAVHSSGATTSRLVLTVDGRLVSRDRTASACLGVEESRGIVWRCAGMNGPALVRHK